MLRRLPYHDTKNAGQVDGVRALRQPGSALKPFVYALAFEKGKLNPGSLLADEDTFFEGGFRPRNYDETYQVLFNEYLAKGAEYICSIRESEWSKVIDRGVRYPM